MDYIEKDIEDYLADYDILTEELGLTYLQRQFQTTFGIIDILAFDETSSALVVIEIKKGTIDENAVGQIMRYIGCMKDLLLHCQETNLRDDLFKEINHVKGILIGNKLSDGVVGIIRHFDFLEFYAHRIKMDVCLETQSFTRTQESLISDFNKITPAIQEKVKYDMKLANDLAEYEREKKEELRVDG